MTITDLFYGLVQPPAPHHAAAEPDEHHHHRAWPARLAAVAGEALGRLLLGGVFLAAAVAHFVSWHGAVAEAAARGVPAAAPMLALGTAVEALGGLSVVLGAETSLGALALAALTAAATPVLDDFWRMGGAEAQAHLEAFLANLALVGVLVVVAARGAGPWSLDALRRRRRQRA
jgi:putative oxidoreductase